MFAVLTLQKPILQKPTSANLANLHIPQMIIMRERIADRVAQEFLKNFLTEFSTGKPLYQSVREARLRLQGLEDEFPYASWLPVICQNPAEIPLTWHLLLHSI
jgi:CHAT domain